MVIQEDFLHYLWKFRLIDQLNLKTISGLPVEVVSPGFHNKNAGPDFENAKLKIGDTLWAGNVEIHVCSSDWYKHAHQHDAAYDNVILHVVFQYDIPVLRGNQQVIETLELANNIPLQLYNSYQELVGNLSWIPCASLISNIDEFHVSSWLSRILIERLEEKSAAVFEVLNEYKGSWDDAFYVLLARNFGFKINALPFVMLARSLPQQILAKHKNMSLQIEALIFGQAGFLSQDFSDEYPIALQNEYAYLKTKYKLKPIDAYLWKFMRLRPQNFPTMRLAQFSALAIKSNHLFSKILEVRDVKYLKPLFSDLPVNDYWKVHYRFDREAKSAGMQIGEESINNILLNTVCLFLFAYGKFTGKQAYIGRAISLLESLPGETNNVARRFREIGLRAEKADQTQALLQLKKHYCDDKKCLNCSIGIKLLNKTP